MTPSACPVVTGSASLESRSKASPAPSAVAGADRQPELAELEQQPALGRLGDAELAQAGLVGVGRAACG